MSNRALRASASAYRFVGHRHVCAYCGARADAQDHTTPASAIRGAIGLMLSYKFTVVASCSDCNARAGAVVDRTFLSRRRRIARPLRKARRRILRTPDWSEEEIDEVGPNIRSVIVSAQREREETVRRLAVLESTALPNDIPDELAEPVQAGVVPFWVAWRKSALELAQPSAA